MIKFFIHYDKEEALACFGGNLYYDKELKLCYDLLKWQNLKCEFVEHSKDGFIKKNSNGRKTLFIVCNDKEGTLVIGSGGFHSLFDYLSMNGLFLC